MTEGDAYPGESRVLEDELTQVRQQLADLLQQIEEALEIGTLEALREAKEACDEVLVGNNEIPF